MLQNINQTVLENIETQNVQNIEIWNDLGNINNDGNTFSIRTWKRKCEIKC